MLIKRRWVGKKMNAMGGMFKDEKKQSNHQNQFVFVARSYVRFQSFGLHSNMSANNAIEKPQIIVREKKAQMNEHRQRQEEEAELLRRTKVKEELR